MRRLNTIFFTSLLSEKTILVYLKAYFWCALAAKRPISLPLREMEHASLITILPAIRSDFCFLSFPKSWLRFSIVHMFQVYWSLVNSSLKFLWINILWNAATGSLALLQNLNTLTSGILDIFCSILACGTYLWAFRSFHITRLLNYDLSHITQTLDSSYFVLIIFNPSSVSTFLCFNPSWKVLFLKRFHKTMN